MAVSPAMIRMMSRMTPNGAFGMAALQLGKTDDKAMFLSADLRTFSGLDSFANEFPDRFYDMGIAEQNMVGVAAGMASEGYHVFATSYATFSSLRSADQVKVNMAYMREPVTLVGLSAGLSVGILGPTHMALEDVAVMNAMPNLVILSPADGLEIFNCVQASAALNSPVYLRLTGGMSCPIVYRGEYPFEIGKAVRLREGDDALILATGSMVSCSLKAAELLAQSGKECTVVNVHTLKPFDEECLSNSLRYRRIVSVEEHNAYCGLGGIVASRLAAMSAHPPLLTLGVSGEYPHAGEYQFLLEQYGLTAEKIARSIDGALEG